MKKKSQGGFTLIELLVVIAIIGILAAVVLASLSLARAKGADANVKSNLANSRAQAELFYDSTGNSVSYDNVCTTGTNNISTLISAASKTAGSTTGVVGGDAQGFVYSTAGATGSAVCHDSASGWAAIVSLKNPTTANSGWCVDSSGKSKESTSLGANVVVCP